jgi:hypothetical protein
MLSERERRLLRGIEIQLERSDPGLARELAGASRRGGAVFVFFATALVVAGAVVMLATFTTSLLAATGGAAVMAVGEGLLLRPVERAAGRVRAWIRESKRS